jgi:probable HAF family extracellular repeat protein
MKRNSGKICIGLISLAVILTLPLIFFPHTAWTAQYTFTTLNHSAATNGTYAYGINNSGQVTGYYLVSSSDGWLHGHGFVYSGGVFTSLDVPSAVDTETHGINDSGQITGGYEDSSYHGQSFVYSGGVFTTLPDPSGYGPAAWGINNSAQVIGYYVYASAVHGFVYSNGLYTSLDVPSAAGGTFAFSINNSGQVAGYNNDSTGGYHGFVYSGGVFTTLDVPSALRTYAYGINDSGQVSGFYVDASAVRHGFVYSGGVFTTLDVPSARYTYANGINNSGQVTGYYWDGSGVYGFIATPVPEPSPPTAKCHDVTLAAGPTCTARASIDNGSYDPNGDPITVAQIPAGPYSLGTTPVTLTVTDSKNPSSQSQCTGTVTVQDKTSPAINMASVNPSALWPPNHKMVDVTVNYAATDNCGQPACKISGVTSNEPISSSDYSIVDAHHVKLSADRLGSGSGRIYTISIACTDASGNSSTQTMAVSVPHDQGKN